MRARKEGRAGQSVQSAEEEEEEKEGKEEEIWAAPPPPPPAARSLRCALRATH